MNPVNIASICRFGETIQVLFIKPILNSDIVLHLVGILETLQVMHAH